MAILARLSFWVVPEQMADFEAAYERQVAPFLEERGFEPSTERGRPTVDGVFSRLFAMPSLDAFFAQRRALLGDPTGRAFLGLASGLRGDPAWTGLLENLGTELGAAGAGGPVRCELTPYQCPATPDRSVPAGGGIRRGAWRTLSVHDGIPCPVCYSLLPVPGGPLWFTGRTHLTRYDGETFVAYRTTEYRKSDFPVPLVQTRDGSLWLNGLGGLAHFDGEAFATYTAADGLAGDDPMCLLEDRQGHLWIGDESGLTRYDGETFRVMTTPDGRAVTEVSSVLEDRDGILWFGRGHHGRPGWDAGEGGGVARYDGKTLSAGAAGRIDHAVSAMLQDRHGALWFGGYGRVTRWDGESSSTLSTGNGLVGGHIRTILESRDGGLWFASTPNGISRLYGTAFTTFTADSGLPNDQVFAMAEDEEGYLWASTRSGVCRYEGTHWTTLTEHDGLPRPPVFSVLQDRAGTLWFGTRGGLVRYDGGEMEVFTAADGMAEDQASHVAEDLDGHLWIKGFQGPLGSRYDGETFTPFSLSDSPDARLCSRPFVDRRGHVWLNTLGGVFRYDGHGFSMLTGDDGLPNDGKVGLAVDRSGDMLLVTREGVFRYDGTSSTPVVGFAGSEILGGNVFEDSRGCLWIGNLEGQVARYDGSEFEILAFEDGLKPGEAACCLEDSRGHIWIRIHGGGIVRTDGLVLQDLHQGDGLVSDAVQTIMEDRDGDFWIATDGGITRYRPSTRPPAVRVVEVVGDRSYGAPSELSLPASQRLLLFRFRGRSFTTSPDRMVYVYRLQGHDEAWLTSRRAEARYADLPVGDYVFEVKAVDRDLNYSEAAAVHLTIEPDPYQQALSQALSGTGAAGEFVGSSGALREVQDELLQVAATDVTVLIQGETGTGKGLAARLVHRASPRRDGPFVQVNCGALPDSLVESELFGHEKGAFTGAHARKLGKVELAKGGTLMLDEIGDLPLDAQVKLLRLLEEETFERVGGEGTLSAEVRVVAATNRDLQQMVHEGQFREDLYFRLAVFPVRLPPLRERVEDIPLLAVYFMERMAAHLNKDVHGLDEKAVAALQRYAWPGNVRELEHAVQRAVIVCRGSTIGTGEIALGPGSEPPGGEVVPLEEVERRYIREVLEQAGWVVSGPRGAAALLGLNPSTLRGRMRKLGLHR